MRQLGIALAVLLSVCNIGCSEPPEFADWTIDVREGTRIIEFAPIPLEERLGSEIGVEEDLVLGGGAGDAQQDFYRRPLAVPDAHGNIYVLDRGNHRVQVFDRNGVYMRTLGREGQGPGELEDPSALAVSGDRLFVKAHQRRINIWKLDGQHVRDIQLRKELRYMAGTENGFVARSQDWLGELSASAPPARRWTFAAYGADGEEQAVFAELDEPPLKPIKLEGPRVRAAVAAGVIIARGGIIPTFSPRFVATRDGTFYLTTSDAYELHAFGSRHWALRTLGFREVVTAADITTAITEFNRGDLAGTDESAFDWPERFPAIVGLEIDGHGHLYVYPFYRPLDAPAPWGTEQPTIGVRPVDVFSADGDHLFSGMTSLWQWGPGAHGDFVFRARINEETEEYEVVRYRLVEPFE